MEISNFKESEQKNWETVFNKCHEDETFKRAFIANPTQEIEKLTGKPMNLLGRNLIVSDQSDRSALYINIPVNSESIELSETELESVAGGIFGWCVFSGDVKVVVVNNH